VAQNITSATTIRRVIFDSKNPINVIVLGVSAGLAFAGVADRRVLDYALAALVIVSMGLLDDRRGLSCFLRLLGQIFAACIVARSGIPLLRLPVDGLPHLWGLEFMLTVIFLVAAVNAVNFLDGLDGLAGGCAFFSLMAIVVVAYHHDDAAALVFAWVLAAAILGFLFYNIYPARVFMGDTGSTFVGFSLGTVTLMAMGASHQRVDLLPALMIVGVPMLDMCAVVLERLSRGCAPYESDRNHIHHKLMTLGLGHGRIVFILYCVQLTAVTSAMLMAGNDILLFLMMLLLVGVPVRWALANRSVNSDPASR
jgi:UDP-GlcNAc:undecaprenyl-phosphate/decaprenyl-phosphate GlcNAc-1-phosphate transferase